jgi:hypothetical protein
VLGFVLNGTSCISDVTRNERARGKDYVMGPLHIFVASTPLFQFSFLPFFRFSLPLKYFLQGISDISLINVDV